MESVATEVSRHPATYSLDLEYGPTSCCPLSRRARVAITADGLIKRAPWGFKPLQAADTRAVLSERVFEAVGRDYVAFGTVFDRAGVSLHSLTTKGRFPTYRELMAISSVLVEMARAQRYEGYSLGYQRGLSLSDSE